MRTFYPLGGTLTALIAVSMIAGCSGNSAPIAPTSVGRTQDPRSMPQPGSQFPVNEMRGRRSDPNRAVTTPSFFDWSGKGKPLVFVSDASGNVVDIYLQRGKNKMVGEITGLNFPQGIATDAAGNVYVANGNTTEVPIYAPPYTGAPKLILDDTGYYPQGVAVSRQGVVGVTNYCAAPSCSAGTGNVVFYSANSSTPCTTVSDALNFGQVFYDNFDDKGNLYITGERADYSANNVGVVKGGCQATSIRLLRTKTEFGGLPSIRVNKRDRIAIAGKSGSVYAIFTYNPPKNGAFGNPVATTLTSSSTSAQDFAFTASGRHLYEANQSDPAVAYKYDYPAGGTAVETLDVGGEPFGVAVTPALVP